MPINTGAALNFRSNISEKPRFEVGGDDGLPDSDLPDSGYMPKAPTAPPTGKPRPRRGNGADVETMSESELRAELDAMQVPREELRWAEKVGAGITAEVFRGSWRDKEVAIKKLNLCTRRSSQLKQEVAFLRETGVAAKIKHRNLVEFFGLSFDQTPYLLITEFCQGSTAYDLLHESDIELAIAQQLRMCCDVASAMAYLHDFRPQIIHRDLKSLNLLLAKVVSSTRDIPHVKVSDFGHAKMKDMEAGWGKMTAEAGTFHWMAPEVAGGNYDEKADVYSFAMVTFEVLCQEVPFEDYEPGDVLRVTMNRERPDLEAVPPSTPSSLVDLMVSCWAHEPANRPDFKQICRSLDDCCKKLFC